MSRLLFPLSMAIVCIGLTGCAPTLNQIYVKSQKAYNQRNYVQAYEYARYAAKNGNVKAAYALGYLYYYGIGTQENPVLARKWMNFAYLRGYKPAHKALVIIANASTIEYPTQQKLPIPI